MLNHFSWNNVSSEAFDTDRTRVIVSKCPSINRPARRYEKYSVPGRNGEIFIPQDAFDNYTQSYELFLYTDEKGPELNNLCEKIATWLYLPEGYADLIDDHENGYLRKAYFTGPMSVQNELTVFGRTTITFSCRPERYLLSGQDKVTATDLSGGWLTIKNPTHKTARPLIEITIPNNFAKVKILTLNNTVTKEWIYTVQTGATKLTIDSDARTWTAPVPYAGKYVTGEREMPLLKEGETMLRIVGLNSSGNELSGYPTWTYVPRWWVL